MTDTDPTQLIPPATTTETENISDDDLATLIEPETEGEKLINSVNVLIHTFQRQTDFIFRALETQLLFRPAAILTGNEKDSKAFKSWRSKLLPYLAFIRKTRAENTGEDDILKPQVHYILGRTENDARDAANALYNDVYTGKITNILDFLDGLEQWWDNWQKSRA